MKDFCRKQPRRTTCEPEIVGNPEPNGCQPFDVCLPFGRSLHFDGICMSVQGEPTIADGEYGVIVVENGCIVGAKPNPVFQYTPPPCTPAAEPCDDGTGSGTLELQSSNCNMLSVDAAGRYGVYLIVEAGDNISLSGCGTNQNPLRISASVDVDAACYINVENDKVLTITGTGSVSNPYIIGLPDSGVTAGTYNGITVDRFGRVTGAENLTSGIVSVVDGNGIATNLMSGVLTISLAESGIDAGSYLLGGYEVELDLAGRVTSARQRIDLDTDHADVDCYSNTLDINSLGSVTAITPIIRTMANAAVNHCGANNNATLNITTDRRGHLYAEWRGCEVISSSDDESSSGSTTQVIPDTAIGLFTDLVSRYLTGNITGGGIANPEPFSSIVGRFEKRTVSSESESGGSATSAQQICLVEWRGISSNAYDPGTYTITITRPDAAGDVAVPLQNLSVLQVQLVI